MCWIYAFLDCFVHFDRLNAPPTNDEFCKLVNFSVFEKGIFSSGSRNDDTYNPSLRGTKQSMLLVFKWLRFDAVALRKFFCFYFLLCFAHILSLVKFRRLPSLRLYSWKIGGYIQGAFFIMLFLFGFYPVFYYFTIIWGILAFSEHIII